jgi:hypothetical protein
MLEYWNNGILEKNKGQRTKKQIVSESCFWLLLLFHHSIIPIDFASALSALCGLLVISPWALQAFVVTPCA